MAELPHGIGYYLEVFGVAAKESPQAGAIAFIEYVRDQQEAGGFYASEAFNICVNNINCRQSFCPDEEKLAIEKAREIMADELTQY